MHTLLIVEDEEALRSTLADRLEMEGFRVHTAPNGEDGVLAAREHLPDLILCDILMPGIDGYGVLRALQRDTATASIPFIFLTAKTDPPEIRAGMTQGADDYLCKPVPKADLLAAIHAQLAKHHERKLRHSQAAQTARLEVMRRLPHELLTPLSGILSASQTLEAADPTKPIPEIRDLGRVLRLASDRLHRTIHRFLLYAQLAVAEHDPAARSRLRCSDYTAASTWTELQAKQTATADSRLADLQLDLTPLEIAIDPAHLSDIVAQLTENAFKFSPPGSVVHVALAWVAGDAVLTIRDQGRGFTPDQICSIGAFRQFDHDILVQSGTGLGLALVQLLVRLYQSTLSIASDPGNGTRVTVRFPSARRSVLLSTTPDAESLRNTAWKIGTRLSN
jgi:signal transduction histidine kinase